MRHDIRPSEIDCVFCWRTITGGVRPGSRDTKFNGKPVPYNAEGRAASAGLHSSVSGRACTHRPFGPRLDEQGCISRMCGFVAGYVTPATLVPARDAGGLDVLREAARAAVHSGDAAEWALAAVHARGRRFMAIHIGAPPAVVADVAGRIEAPWTLEVREKVVGSWMKGAQIVCLGRDGLVIETFDGETLFGEARLPGPRSGVSC
jgi:hypothetical protein